MYSIRSHFAKVEHELQAALAHKNPDVFWRIWSSAAEGTDRTGLRTTAQGERRHYTCSESTERHRFSKTTSSMRPFSTKATEQHRLKRQIHKIVHHVRKPSKPIAMRGRQTCATLGKMPVHNEMWTQHTSMTTETPTSWVALIKNLHRAVRSIEQHVQRLIHDEYKERRTLFAAKLADDATGNLDFRTIREPQARPIHTDPMMTDIMTTAWTEVYKGTDRSDEQVLQDFGA